MRKLEMIVFTLLTALFCNNANARIPVTNITSVPANIDQLAIAIDTRVNLYMLAKTSEAATTDKNPDELVGGIVKDIEKSTAKSGVDFGDVVIELGKIYDRRIEDSDKKVAECSKAEELTKKCVHDTVTDAKNRLTFAVLSMAIINHYLGPLDKLKSELLNDPVRKYLDQQLEEEKKAAVKEMTETE